MAIIESLKAFFEECPLLRDGFINVNYLGAKKADYSIESVPSEPVIRRYVDGGSLRQFVFVFASREYYDEDQLRNMDTARFYEELGAWIEERCRARRLPALTEGTALKLEVTAGGYLLSDKAGTARFQLQCRLIYRKEG